MARIPEALGYATGQFGKNHLGDRNEYLPTVHGFDEFFGNLYHLNAEEEPQNPDYPKDPNSDEVGPRGVLKCKATDKDDPTIDGRAGRGASKQSRTRPLPKEAMQTVDKEFLGAALDFIDRKTQGRHPMVLLLQPDGASGAAASARASGRARWRRRFRRTAEDRRSCRAVQALRHGDGAFGDLAQARHRSSRLVETTA